MRHADFDLKALYEALEEQRCSRQMSWAAAALEINRGHKEGHPIATSTITGLKNKRAGEGDGILSMLLWLGRTPESFYSRFRGRGRSAFPLAETRRRSSSTVEYQGAARGS